MKNLKIFFIVFLCIFNINVYSKPLIIGTEAYAPPFEVRTVKGKFFGFDIDIMSAICKQINEECTFKSYNFYRLPEALQTGEIDLAIAAIIITPERERNFQFSLPYKINFQQLMVLKSSNYDSPSELAGKKIGVFTGSPDFEFISDKFEGTAEIKSYANVNELILALKEKKVDAIVLSISQGAYWISNYPEVKHIGRPFRVGEGYGIAAKLGKTQLINRINRALENIEKNGVYLEIYRTYY
jgi:ABC-type amino acid transport substrate-binding protein